MNIVQCLLLPGFLIVAACVITFETRDNAAKVAPTTSSFHGGSLHGSHSARALGSFRRRSRRGGGSYSATQALQFRSSSSQTTFLDRNIIETLGVTVSGVGAGAPAATAALASTAIVGTPLPDDCAPDGGVKCSVTRTVSAKPATAPSGQQGNAAPTDYSRDSGVGGGGGGASNLATTQRASIGGTVTDGELMLRSLIKLNTTVQLYTTRSI